MIEKIRITDNTKTDRHYINKIPAFKNGAEYTFKEGVNIIVGENGSGKTTLINLLKDYLLIDVEWCGRGVYGKTITRIMNYSAILGDVKSMYDGVEVFADYELNTFCYTPFEERDNSEFMETGRFSEMALNVESGCLSKGQKSTFALSTLFQKMFSKNAILKFDYKKEFGEYKAYMDYIEKHKIENKKVWTILLDEPDCSVDIEKLKELYGVLSFNKEHTQIICVIHNPFLIAKLAKLKNVNIIEMSKGYVKKIQKAIKEFEKL